MRMRTGQLIYKVRSVDGLWLKKVTFPDAEWTESEEEAHIFRKLHHLRAEMKTGILAPVKLDKLLGGLPPEALQVVEFRLTVHQTGRKHRLTEVMKFYSEEGKKKEPSQDVENDV